MAEGIAPKFPVEVIRKWLDLAERRKAYLVDLYETGRWQLFYSEAEFVKRLREAIDAVGRWSITEQTSLESAGHGLAVDAVAAEGTAGEPNVSPDSV